MSVPATVTEWTTRDTLYATGIGISLLFSIISTIFSVLSFSNTKKRDLNSFGDSEIKAFELITDAEAAFLDFNNSILEEQREYESNPKNSQPYKMSEHKKGMFQSKAEAVLNAYNILCQRYLDGKLDKVRFAKSYASRIHTVCSNKNYWDILNNGSYNYSALIQVNKGLNDRER
jgi:hypothetical protein